MTPEPDIHDVVRRELDARGHGAAHLDDTRTLVAAGVSSVTLVQVLSALEDAYDVDLDVERIFAGPVTVRALVDGVAHALAAR